MMHSLKKNGAATGHQCQGAPHGVLRTIAHHYPLFVPGDGY